MGCCSSSEASDGPSSEFVAPAIPDFSAPSAAIFEPQRPPAKEKVNQDEPLLGAHPPAEKMDAVDINAQDSDVDQDMIKKLLDEVHLSDDAAQSS